MTNCIMRIFRCHKINKVIVRGEKFFKGFSLFACRKKDYFSESKNIILYIIIKNMLQKGKTPEDIADMTGESLDEILEFAKNITVLPDRKI